MTILIRSEKVIKEIQDEFHSLFPYLRMEFFIRSADKSKETVRELSSHLTVGAAYKVTEYKQLVIRPETVVKDFERDFAKEFGMFVQLYRKSGTLWQKITITDTWTMKQQNETGKEISSIVEKEIDAKAKITRLFSLV